MNTMRISSSWIAELTTNGIVVFGGNLERRHCNGAAKLARQKIGAVWGVGVGLRRQSHALPIMQGGISTIHSRN